MENTIEKIVNQDEIKIEVIKLDEKTIQINETLPEQFIPEIIIPSQETSNTYDYDFLLQQKENITKDLENNKNRIAKQDRENEISNEIIQKELDKVEKYLKFFEENDNRMDNLNL